jgi:hypothetical protein
MIRCSSAPTSVAWTPSAATTAIGGSGVCISDCRGGRRHRLDGDFVECGVNYGFLSSAVMEFLDWDRLGKTFYLLDTFAGIDPGSIAAGERRAGTLDNNQKHLRDGFYVSSVDGVRANFAQ